jgi:hypothetical protein
MYVDVLSIYGDTILLFGDVLFINAYTIFYIYADL